MCGGVGGGSGSGICPLEIHSEDITKIVCLRTARTQNWSQQWNTEYLLLLDSSIRIQYTKCSRFIAMAMAIHLCGKRSEELRRSEEITFIISNMYFSMRLSSCSVDVLFLFSLLIRRRSFIIIGSLFLLEIAYMLFFTLTLECEFFSFRFVFHFVLFWAFCALQVLNRTERPIQTHMYTECGLSYIPIHASGTNTVKRSPFSFVRFKFYQDRRTCMKENDE